MSKWNKYIEDEKQGSSRQNGARIADSSLFDSIKTKGQKARQELQQDAETQQTLPQPKSAGQLWTSYGGAGNSATASGKAAQPEQVLAQTPAQTQAQAQAAGSAEESGSDYDKILQSYRELASSQLDKLDLQRTEARREASVLSDRVSRYLPYLRRSGNTEGSGLGDTADIAAYNRLQNRYSEVDADFAEKQADIMDSYRQTAAAMAKEEADRKWQSQETAADREWQTAEAEANRAWQTEENEKNRAWQTNENEKQASVGSYADAATALGSWFESMADDSGKIGSGDLAQLQAFADVFKENLSAADAAQLDTLLAGYHSFVRNDTEQAVHDKQTAVSSAQYETYLKQMAEIEKMQTYSGLAKATMKEIGDLRTVSITLDNEQYGTYIIDDNVTDEIVLQAAEMAGTDQPFILNGHMYMMTRGGGEIAAGTVLELGDMSGMTNVVGGKKKEGISLTEKIKNSQAK